jgi:hypothetical protein
MKNTRLNQGLFVALLLTASVVSAQDYPAADFQPKVIYRDETVVNVTPTNSASNPCVTKEDKVEVDAKYPAANFQPKVIYSSSGS